MGKRVKIKRFRIALFLFVWLCLLPFQTIWAPKYGFRITGGQLVAAPTDARGGQKKRLKKRPFYKRYEIRVIRERYFKKRFRVEASLAGGGVANSAFINSLVATPSLGFHITEMIGVEIYGQRSQSFFSESYTKLESEFGVFPQVVESRWQWGFNLLLTPIYGKALSIFTDIAYFDTFLQLGWGIGGLDVTKSISRGSSYYNEKSKDKDRFRFEIPLFNVGGGQRFFLNQELAVKWEIRDSIFYYKGWETVAAFEKEVPNYLPDNTFTLYHDLQFMIGVSYFFF